MQVTKNGIEFKILNLTAEADGQIYRMKEYMDSKLTDEIFRPLMAAAG
jgi:hypothetical protein